MKIAFVLDDGLDSTDGVQQYVLTLGTWLTRKGHQVSYLVGQTTRQDVPRLHSLSKNIQVAFNKNRLTIPLPAHKGTLKELLVREKYDVIHVQMPFSPLLAGRIVRMAPRTTAIVGTFHIMPFGKLHIAGSRLLGRLTRTTADMFDSVAAVSPAARAFAKQAMHISSHVIPNAVNLTDFSRAMTVPAKAEGGQIVFLGRLVPRKGCLELIQAVKLLVETKRYTAMKLIVCGDGPERKKIEAYITRHQLADYVTLVGRVSDQEKASYLASADVAIFPSLGGESFGIVLVEAIAAGAGVVIGGDNPGYRFVLNNEKRVLVDPTNTELFAKKIDYILSNPKEAQAIGQQQRKFIEQFNVTQVGRQIVDMYTQAIAKRLKQGDNTYHESTKQN